MPSRSADRLAALARPRGTFAMLALDQRESLRAMLVAARAEATDEALSRFKVQAVRSLTPFASAVLPDVAHGLTAGRGAKAIAPRCRLIAASGMAQPERAGARRGPDVD